MNRLSTLIIFSMICFTILANYVIADNSIAIVKEWAKYDGHSDSVFVVPVLNDSDYTYTASAEVQATTGVDIVITKRNKDGVKVWSQTWSGSGAYRDQPSDMVMDNEYLYISGITFSPLNNYDYVILRFKKDSGALDWVNTYNSAFSNYDVTTSIGISWNAVYVTGVSFDQTSLANYYTIKYSKSGTYDWAQTFDYNSFMDIAFDISIGAGDSTIIVTGASQSSISDWDYQTVVYNPDGTITSSSRVSGSSAGFDRAQSVKNDAAGNIYLTGAVKGTYGDYDIKTVKLSPTGSYI